MSEELNTIDKSSDEYKSRYNYIMNLYLKEKKKVQEKKDEYLYQLEKRENLYQLINQPHINQLQMSKEVVVNEDLKTKGDMFNFLDKLEEADLNILYMLSERNRKIYEAKSDYEYQLEMLNSFIKKFKNESLDFNYNIFI